jgi:hypothetical protein
MNYLLVAIMEYNFSVIYKFGWSHLVANAFSQLLNSIENLGVLNQTIDIIFLLYNQSSCKRSIITYILDDNLAHFITEQK